MKKVCIVTWHKVANYGAQLQAYAMKQILEGYGYEVFFYDYKRTTHNHNYYTMMKAPFKTCKKIFMPVKIITEHENSFYSEKASKLKKFATSNFVHGNKDEIYDLCVIGSDEIFSISDGYNSFQFAPDIKADRIISYAASFGATTYGMIRFYHRAESIKKYLERVDELSVRDKNSQYILAKLLKRNVRKNIDPIFLWNWKREISIEKQKLEIILFYSYDAHHVTESQKNQIKDFARENNLKIVSVGYYHSWCDQNVIPSSLEFVKYVYEAKYIVTTTFHGTAFSILFNKRFAVILQDNNREKLEHLLEEFKAVNHVVDNMFSVRDRLLTDSNFEKLVDMKRKEAFTYLNKECNVS